MLRHSVKSDLSKETVSITRTLARWTKCERTKFAIVGDGAADDCEGDDEREKNVTKRRHWTTMWDRRMDGAAAATGRVLFVRSRRRRITDGRVLRSSKERRRPLLKGSSCAFAPLMSANDEIMGIGQGVIRCAPPSDTVNDVDGVAHTID